jgi:rare lipoprotein A (peptidoglycan hydrolase)
LRRAGVGAAVLSIAAAGSTAAGAQRPLVTGGKRMHVKIGGRAAVVKGKATPGAVVRFQAWHRGKWSTLGKTRVRSGGKFKVRAKPDFALSAGARIAAAGQTRRVGRLNVYRYAEASWYGPGLYGGHLACGGTLTPGTQGVANKSLPCGTKVTIRHGAHVARVKVVDRGPYSGNREYDLTAATARKLHFSGTGAILTTK